MSVRRVTWPPTRRCMTQATRNVATRATRRNVGRSTTRATRRNTGRGGINFGKIINGNVELRLTKTDCGIFRRYILFVVVYLYLRFRV